MLIISKLSCAICFDHESFLRHVSPTVRPFISYKIKLDRFADYHASIQVNYFFHHVVNAGSTLFHVAVPEFSAHATVSFSSSQSSGYSNISRSSYEMLERLVISLSNLIHVFLKFQEWFDSCVFNPKYHLLGDVTYHLGYNFVTSQRPTSKGLVCC